MSLQRHDEESARSQRAQNAADEGALVLGELPKAGSATGTMGSTSASSRRGGIEVGDRVVAVDGTAVSSSGDLMLRARGPVGTSVRLTISRDGKEQTVELTRAQLDK